MNENKFTKAIFYLLFILTSIACISVLKITSTFILPIVISIMLSFVFYPIVKKLASFHIPWVAGILIILVIALGIFTGVGNLLVSSCMAIVNAYPKYEAKLTAIYTTIAGTLGIPFDENSSLLTNLWNSLGARTFIQNTAISLSNFLISGAKVLFLISLLILFFMMEMRGTKEKIRSAFPEEHVNRKIIYITIKIISDVTRFVSIKFVISLATGILVGLSCIIARLDFPIVWGFLAFILNFIPNFGSAISFAITTLFSVVQFAPDSIGKVVFIGLAVLLINSTLGSIIEPKWEGKDLGVSPFLILVSLTLWGFIWGFAGMILSVPLLVIIKIICENIEMLNPVAVLIGSTKKFTKSNAHKAD